MLTEEKIKQFYKDVESLKLKYPVAEISRLTGFGKPQVSHYLRGKENGGSEPATCLR